MDESGEPGFCGWVCQLSETFESHPFFSLLILEYGPQYACDGTVRFRFLFYAKKTTMLPAIAHPLFDVSVPK